MESKNTAYRILPHAAGNKQRTSSGGGARARSEPSDLSGAIRRRHRPAGHLSLILETSDPSDPGRLSDSRHNEDGSYSYGFEAADGSYKIESKYPTGEVHGKYGFIDDTGSLREIEYGASSKRGFEPQGTGINVPPPTVNGNSIADEKDDPNDDGSYREDPSIYYTDPRYTNGERYDPVPKRYNPIQNHQVYSNYNSPR